MSWPGLLLVLSGPSGAGKGTLCKTLLKKEKDIVYSISATTRMPRQGEEDGASYYFVSEQQFSEMVSNGDFLEWAEVYSNRYGTLRGPVENWLRSGRSVVLEIDIQGARQVKRNFPEGVFVFVVPPSLAVLRERIIGRATDSLEEIESRLSLAREEIGQVSSYDYVVVNDRLEEAVAKLRAVLLAERCRPNRNREFLERMLFEEGPDAQRA